MKKLVTMCVVVGLTLAAQAPAASLTDGLQSYWNFDQVGPQYDDQVGSLHLREKGAGSPDVATINAETTGALIGRSIHNTTNDTEWLRSLNPMGTFNITDEYTISYWEKQDVNSIYVRNYFHRASTDPDNSLGEFNNFSSYDRLSYYADASNWQFWSFYVLDGGVSKEGYGFGTAEGINYRPPEGEWHHRVLTIAPDGTVTDNLASINDDDMSLGQIATHDAAFEGVSNYTGVDVAAFQNHYLTALGGLHNPGTWVDEWAIWNRALSTDEIELLHDMGRTGTPIPEPATIMLLSAALPLWLRRRLA